MSVKMKIKVTKEILEKSSMCAYTIYKGEIVKATSLPYYDWNETNSVIGNCAIALAVREIFPHAAVTPNAIAPFHYDKTIPAHQQHGIDLPICAMKFIPRFDMCTPELRKNLPPMEFEIDIPDAIIEQLPLPDIQEMIKDSKTLELV